MVWEENDDEEQVTTEYLAGVVENTTSLYRSQTAENFTNLRQIIVLTELVSECDTSRKCSKEMCGALEEDLHLMRKEQ
jgi:hypothetical protein